MRHVFITQDYGPDRGGMARRHVELVRRYSDSTESMSVSTVRLDGDTAFDRGEAYDIHRQAFHFREANRFTNQLRWTRWLNEFCDASVDVIHCGNIRPAGYAAAWVSARKDMPYVLYVNGGDLLRERLKSSRSLLKRATARRVLGKAAGIAATSDWVAALARDVMHEVGVNPVPPVEALGLGTDPNQFAMHRDTGELRARWGVGDSPLLLTVARLVPHKGQDTVLRVLASLKTEFPALRYVMVGEGHHENQLRVLATELGVADRVVFAGALSDEELPEAYATSTIYVGASRIDREINAEGFGISFLEASSSGLPVVAGDSGGVRSAVRDGVTGMVVPPLDVPALGAAVSRLLSEDGPAAFHG